MEDTPREGLHGPPEAEPPGRPGEAGPARPPKSSAPLWAALGLLCLLTVIQGAGVLLRDRLEGRLAVGAAPPPGEEAGAREAREGSTAAPAGTRFPPPVREVVVASAPPAGPPAPPPAREVAPGTVPAPAAAPSAPAPPAAGGAPPAAPQPAPAAAPVSPTPAPPPLKVAEPAPNPAATSAPEVERAAPPPPVAVRDPGVGPGAGTTEPRRAGTHVLQMGVFRSQKYRRETEQRLDALGVPHYRVEGAAKGDSFRLAVPAGDEAARERARAALDRAGYLYRETPDGIEVRFFLEEEARQALDAVSRAGLPGAGYLRVPGEMPLWTVLAGPFSEEQARAERERLAREGLESYLRRRP